MGRRKERDDDDENLTRKVTGTLGVFPPLRTIADIRKMGGECW